MAKRSKEEQIAFQLMMAKIQMSGLDEKDAQRLHFKLIPSADALKRWFPSLTDHPAAGFVIPYYDIRSKPTKFFRYRYLLEPKRTGFDALVKHKQVRYIQPAKMPPRVYFSPLCDWKDVFAPKEDRAILITEGELKANCAVKMGLPCIGLGGVWNFRNRNEDTGLIEDLAQIDWRGIVVYIVYDSDAQTNYQVLQAENTLARELLNRGAEVVVVRLPNILESDQKTGLDDYLVKMGAEELLRLCENSKQWKTSQVLHELNEEVVFVHEPGVVLELATLQRMTPYNFTSSIYANRILEERIVGKTGEKLTKKCAAKEWLQWPMRAEVKCVTYKPGEPRITAKGELNSWPGWGMNGTTIAQGSIKLWKELLDFLFEQEPEEAKTWFEKWLAYPLQYPGTKLFSAIVLWGGVHGTGKSLVGYTMERIYGKNWAEIADRDLTSNFNEWAENRQFVMGDEITGGDKRAQGDRMKGLITQKFIRLNPKFIPSYTVPDCINYYFTSNHADSFFIEDSDRRYFIHEVRASKPMSESFYVEYDKWYKSEAVGALFWYLLSLDLTDFNPNARPPMTSSKTDMIQINRSDLGEWVATLREQPDKILKIGDVPLKYTLMTSQELHALYDPSRSTRVSVNGLSRELRRAGFRKLFGGDIVFTSLGNQRLWAVRDFDKFHAPNLKRAEVAKIYEKERAFNPLGQKEQKF